jgi:hypothetical protein
MQGLFYGDRIDQTKTHAAFRHIANHAAILPAELEIHQLRRLSSPAATAVGGWWRGHARKDPRVEFILPPILTWPGAKSGESFVILSLEWDAVRQEISSRQSGSSEIPGGAGSFSKVLTSLALRKFQIWKTIRQAACESKYSRPMSN